MSEEVIYSVDPRKNKLVSLVNDTTWECKGSYCADNCLKEGYPCMIRGKPEWFSK